MLRTRRTFPACGRRRMQEAAPACSILSRNRRFYGFLPLFCHSTAMPDGTDARSTTLSPA